MSWLFGDARLTDSLGTNVAGKSRGFIYCSVKPLFCLYSEIPGPCINLLVAPPGKGGGGGVGCMKDRLVLGYSQETTPLVSDKEFAVLRSGRTELTSHSVGHLLPTCTCGREKCGDPRYNNLSRWRCHTFGLGRHIPL